MKSAFFFGLLLVGLVSTAPTTNNEKLVVDEDFFPEEIKVYEGNHEIVKIYVPINKLNFDEDDDSNKDAQITLFFVEADVSDAGTVDQGLYVKIGDKVTKLLDHGRDIAAPDDEESKVAYFATKDGIYVYNAEENKATKYGTIDDELIGIAMAGSNSMYVLTADKKVYKVSEDGNKKEKVDDIKNAEQIVTDNANNLFYVDFEKKVFIVNSNGVKQIEGLPEHFSKITLIRPPFLLAEGGIPIVVDKKAFTLHTNGTLEEEDIEIDANISAYSMEASIIHYYGRNKKIYEYNFLVLILGDLLKKLQDFLGSLKSSIQNIGTQNKNELINSL